ncbi:heat shock protein [Halanaerobium saccharolyticum]|uniref:Protease HtpX homolog n=1 Tax=Halanaerobium saccharolyticum TaxID=43595 RepID=A0A4R7YTB0_9FIRM|nr:zinc metalloprotease HtpX [Halanaerobium saccharolyticum]RAK06490.1 heat shock protein [Halanaerobium saccharolyticum]TDW01034.1 heat shock protein [Halanaerobium saccharolyticum]TDX52615.1 heat shock protein [Halanaerobium saccharolyticum]
MHRTKTFLLMFALIIVFMFFGGMIAGEDGIVMAFIFALAINFISYWNSDKIAIKMTKSKPLSESEAPEIYRIVKKLTQNAEMPMPDIYLTPSNQPNAFATGRNPEHAAVAVTQGLIRLLNENELEGVIAHELAHVKNRDTLISTMAAVMAGALAFLSRIGRFRMIFGGRRRNNGAGALLQLAAIIFAPLAAILIKMAISRSREYIADETGGKISGNPEGLASALEKMERYSQGGQQMQINEAAAHMFILNPLSREGMAKLFSSHPPTAERIKRLRQAK